MRCFIMVGSHTLFASVFPLCFCLTQNEYSSHYRFTSFVTKSAVILGRLAPEKESGFCDFEEFNHLHCWWLRNEMVEICILLDGMVMSPVLFNSAKTMVLTTSNNGKCKQKLSKCRILYYANTVATRQLLLLSGDVETNPG